MLKWYAIRVVSGQENKVSKLITSMAEDELFPMEVGDVHVPTEMVISNRNGKQYSQRRKLLPGYALVELDVPQVGWRNVVAALRSIDGVIGFASAVSIGDKPVPLTEEEARGMLQFGKDGATGTPVRIKQNFSKGESVKIIEGPFDGFVGAIDEIDDDRGTIKVTVEIFGRETPIDLSFGQVEKI